MGYKFPPVIIEAQPFFALACWGFWFGDRFVHSSPVSLDASGALVCAENISLVCAGLSGDQPLLPGVGWGL